MKADLRTRLTQSIEARPVSRRLRWWPISWTAANRSSSAELRLPRARRVAARAAAAHLFVQLPHGACPRCTGLVAAGDRSRPSSSRIRRSRSTTGALVRGRSEARRASTRRSSRRSPTVTRSDTSAPVVRPHRGAAEVLPVRTTAKDLRAVPHRMGRPAQYMLAFDGIVEKPSARYKETDSSQPARAHRGVHVVSVHAPYARERVEAEVLAVTVGKRSINDFTTMSVTRALHFLDGARPEEGRKS